MFDNLVESSSHKDDISRKGSFILASPLSIYGVLMVAFFVAGIYWYDAHLGEHGARADHAGCSGAGAAATETARTETGSEADKGRAERRRSQGTDCRRYANRVGAEGGFCQGQRRSARPARRDHGDWQLRLKCRCANAVRARHRHCRCQRADQSRHCRRTATTRGEANSAARSDFRRRAQRQSDQLTETSVSTNCQSSTCFRHRGGPGAIDENGNVISARAVSGHPLLQAVAVGAARQSEILPNQAFGAAS